MSNLAVHKTLHITILQERIRFSYSLETITEFFDTPSELAALETRFVCDMDSYDTCMMIECAALQAWV